VQNVQWTFVLHRPERSVDQRPQGLNEILLKIRLQLGKRSFPFKVLSNFFKSW